MANSLPVGFALPEWRVPPAPPRQTLEGLYCRVEPLDPACHAAALYAASQLDAAGLNYTYMAYGPFASCETYRQWLQDWTARADVLFHAIVNRQTGQAEGLAECLVAL